jgi:hypothetical protein
VLHICGHGRAKMSSQGNMKAAISLYICFVYNVGSGKDYKIIGEAEGSLDQ